MKLRVHELRNKSKGDLEKQLEELKTELAALRVAPAPPGDSAAAPTAASSLDSASARIAPAACRVGLNTAPP